MRVPAMTVASFLAMGGFSPCLGQYMALTHHAAPEALHGLVPTSGRWPSPPVRPSDRLLAGDLPNQRTGLRHEHVVRDICIGCDR
ncbi:hypothetical protein FV223_10355 [Methylobacterium sp. WL116]|nr:hypothetical protein FV223_10355 [Methylobacterium sp. WL116]